VQGATLSNVSLLGGSMWTSGFHIEGEKTDTGNNRDTPDLDDVGPTYFSVMQIPILAGRTFGPQDTPTSQPVSVITQSLAKQFFPHSNPVGQRFRTATGDSPEAKRWIQIIGICADVRYQDMRQPPPPVHFDLYTQMNEIDGVTFAVRSTLSPDTLLSSLRHAVAAIDPDLPITQIRTQGQQIAFSMQQETMFASLTTGFGVLALLLACVGIYGIMAYTVSQRTNEIGIRLALGAVRGQIRSMVLREAAWLATAGVAAGVGLALLLSKAVDSLLYGLKPRDPLSLAATALLLLAVALLSSWLPAARASGVEPMEALRHE
jgi:predicted permease